jgi:hypothetical protein
LGIENGKVILFGESKNIDQREDIEFVKEELEIKDVKINSIYTSNSNLYYIDGKKKKNHFYKFSNYSLFIWRKFKSIFLLVKRKSIHNKLKYILFDLKISEINEQENPMFQIKHELIAKEVKIVQCGVDFMIIQKSNNTKKK